MRELRLVGNRIKTLADMKGISNAGLSRALDISINDVDMGLAGRKFFSYNQLEKIADFLEVEIDKFFSCDSEEYRVYSMDFMKEFRNNSNKEEILDIIYDYLDVYDALGAGER